MRVYVLVSVRMSEQEVKYGEYCTSCVFTSQSGIGVIYPVNTCLLSPRRCECVCVCAPVSRACMGGCSTPLGVHAMMCVYTILQVCVCVRVRVCL